MRAHTFDLELLRTLVAVVDCGGFVAASHALNCTQSAVSHQIRRLEERAGAPLFEKDGRHKRLTSSGERLVSYARRLLDLNDEAYRALVDTPVSMIRVGLPEYFADDLLPNLLMRYSERFPTTRLDVRFARSNRLRESVDHGDLDCALLLSLGGARSAGAMLRMPVVWLGSNEQQEGAGAIPLVTFDQQCAFRVSMIQTLEQAGMPWRIAYTANSLADLKAAVCANLGITALIASGNLYGLYPVSGLPGLPGASVCVHHSPGTPSSGVQDFMQVVQELFPRLCAA